VAAILFAFVLFSESGWEESEPMMEAVLYMIGLVLIGIATIGRLWCSLYIAGYKNSRLIQEGPYSACRNPLYFFSLIGSVGVGFSTETILYPVIIFVVFLVYYPFTIRKEEVYLLSIYGQEFEEYMKRVPRFWPNFRMLNEPDLYEVKPVIFRKHIMDALWFVFAAGVIEVFEVLRELGWISQMLTFY
jgi:protein-S-isoprenylcysteine O-methyltransferase Ste14